MVFTLSGTALSTVVHRDAPGLGGRGGGVIGCEVLFTETSLFLELRRRRERRLRTEATAFRRDKQSYIIRLMIFFLYSGTVLDDASRHPRQLGHFRGEAAQKFVASDSPQREHDIVLEHTALTCPNFVHFWHWSGLGMKGCAGFLKCLTLGVMVAVPF